MITVHEVMMRAAMAGGSMLPWHLRKVLMRAEEHAAGVTSAYIVADGSSVARLVAAGVL